MIVIDILIIIFSSIGILTSVGILFLIFYYRRQHSRNTSILLLCNTYLAIIFTCFNFILMLGYSLYGDLNENISFDTWWCYALAYLVHVGLCLIHYSFLLQSCFRLFRVAFFRFIRLRNFQFMFKLILVQWLISFLLIMSILLLHYFEYMPDYHHCQILFSNSRGLLMALLIIFLGPTIASTMIYIYIIYHIKHRINPANRQNRRRSHQRDLVVLRCVIILNASVFIICIPTVVFWIYYRVNSYLHPLSYHFEWLLFSASLLMLSVASAILTPQLRRLIMHKWTHHPRIHPMVIN
jgi:hypothetical protein